LPLPLELSSKAEFLPLTLPLDFSSKSSEFLPLTLPVKFSSKSGFLPLSLSFFFQKLLYMNFPSALPPFHTSAPAAQVKASTIIPSATPKFLAN